LFVSIEASLLPDKIVWGGGGIWLVLRRSELLKGAMVTPASL